MKKRILALLLAGLLTASLASCLNSKDRPGTFGDDTGTEADQTTESTTEEPIATVTWVDVNETVYVIASSVTLTNTEDNTDTLKAKQLDELKRVKISSDGKRCIVEKDGKQYYASNANLTNADLNGKSFTTCNKTMYAIDVVKMRTYAIIESFSESGQTLKKDDQVTVVAMGESDGVDWYKIKTTDQDNKPVYFFVSAKYLSEEKIGSYEDLFTACTETPMYVTADSLYLRLAPSTSANADKNTLSKDDEVIVIAKGSGAYKDWYYVKVANPKEEGMAQTYSKYYVYAAYLSDVKSGSAMTLEELLEKYPSFEEEEKTLYVSADSLNVRTSPNADNSNNLVQPGLVKKDEVKVMATGLVDGKLWSIIEYSEGVYHFVRTSYLTPNSNGEVVITLAELLEKNTEFTEQTETKATATQKTYGFTSLASNPTTADAAIEIASGTSVTIVASGSKYEANWYIIEDSEGMYYFVFAEFFTTSASVG